MEPLSGLEPLAYALRGRYAFALYLGKLQEKGAKWY